MPSAWIFDDKLPVESFLYDEKVLSSLCLHAKAVVVDMPIEAAVFLKDVRSKDFDIKAFHSL
jgi:hypothetical protein